ncbi:MAG TPA: CoA transferase [Sphingobium sp.]|uniref:CoA transferase n=1 Tax=Sphingobium sp. TaxID=1912891 RepID=UPI002ED39460
MPTDATLTSPYPLSGWAERQVTTFRELTGAPALRDLRGAGLLVERAAINGFAVPGTVSAGGGCRLLPAKGGWVALNLAREDDRALLPALFLDGELDPESDAAVAAALLKWDAEEIVARGREMGLALAGLCEAYRHGNHISPSASSNKRVSRAVQQPPLVIDLSALWAGPLAGHLLWLAGAEVIKVESRRRPDAMRDGDAGLFTLLNQGKANVALDLKAPADRDALLSLIARADIVIEAARPRALRQLGIDADALVRAHPGLSWVTITGHGVEGEAADWVGFGDDCGVAGGLSAALCEVTGQVGFVGDAIADPLTGLAAANAAWAGWASGEGGRITLSMSGIVRSALDEERARDEATLQAGLHHWATRMGQPITTAPVRTPTASVAALGADNAKWLISC